MLSALSRRHFLVAMAGAVAAARLRVALRVGLVAPGGADGDGVVADATRGARLGADEAGRAAALFGGGVELLVDADARALLGAGAAVLVGGFDDAACARLVALAGARGALLVNVGAAGDALRSACRPHAFHVAASAAMVAAARDAAAGGRVELWHASLEKFGAEQLNARYRARFGRGMTSAAWAAWMALKAVGEAALRAGSAEPAALGAYLARPGVRLDGHKGRPLTFGTGGGDHQLRQPLYVVRAGADGAERAEEIAPRDAAPAACEVRS